MFNLSENELNRVQTRIDMTEGGAEASLTDMVIDPVIEGFLASPTAQAINFVRSGAMDSPSMMGEEVNKIYGLEGTPVAFEQGEAVSERHAKYVANQWADQQAANFQKKMIEEKYTKPVAAVSSFVGNLVGGMADPLNIALGLGTGAAMTKMGFYSIEQVSKSVTIQGAKAASKWAVTEAAGMSIAENLIINTATEYSFGKLHEYATNQEITTEERIFGILAGTVLGAGIQTTMTARAASKALDTRTTQLGMEFATPDQKVSVSLRDPYISKTIKREKVKATQLVEQHGEAAEQLLQDATDHAIKSEANWVVYNPDYVKNRLDVHLHETRSYQTPYAFKQLDTMTVAGTPFYGASKNATFQTGFGVGFSDNPNYINNYATREGIRVEADATIDTFDMSKATILSSDSFAENKPKIVGNFRDYLNATLKENNQQISPELDAMLNLHSDWNHGDFKEYMDGVRVLMAESDIDVDVDGIMRKSLQDVGFDGVHMTINKGEPNAHNMVYVFDSAKAEKVASDPVTPFNPEMEPHIVNKLKDLELKEFERFQDPTQKMDYDPKVDAEASKVIAETVDEDKAIMDSLIAESELFDEIDGTAAPKVDAEGKPVVLDEEAGMRQSLKADDHESAIKMLANCFYKG